LITSTSPFSGSAARLTAALPAIKAKAAATVQRFLQSENLRFAVLLARI
jgi:hypothetical protein